MRMRRLAAPLLPGLPAGLLCAALLPTPAAQAADAGSVLYGANCAMCHQAEGAGAPGQYPPLKNRIDKIAATPEGKQYLANLLLYGMVGKIQAAGADYFGYMPAFKGLTNDQIATILTWLSALGDSKPTPAIAAADIEAARAKPLSSTAVAAERKALASQHPLP